MKICFIVPEYGAAHGGIATYYIHLVHALRDMGLDVSLIEGSGFAQPRWILPRDIVVQVESAGDEFQHLDAAPSLKRMLRAAWRVWNEVRRAGPFDVIEVVDFALLATPAILEPIAPTLFRLHGSMGQISRFEPNSGLAVDHALAFALETEILKHVDACETPSVANADYWKRQSGRPVRCVRPCWKPISEVTSRSEVDGLIRVFGRIQAWKGPNVVAEAWSSAPDLPDIDWHGRDVATSARGGSTDAELRRNHHHTWGVRIHPRQPVAPEQVARLQSRSLLNLVPSTWDVFNFTAVEAMASGRPVLCSDKAGASEMIEDGRNGFVYDGDSPHALADAVRSALSLGPKRLAQIGAEGKACIVEALRPETRALEHLDGYAAAIRASDLPAVGIPDWFKAMALPREHGGSRHTHLDQHALRELVNYVVERSLYKAGLKA
ncbi:glycosyltransferase involved in cell wall biosynthesis [Rhodoblastus acidophilus]|uniref:glycosyltransferase family 4 protein n=1 Tax=Rhodoblastus acidophilus TaxID=1074 RepID=UPI00222523B0|nr:glycosyltransferase family 4 protein [Rhodoblastus acidophilus]MCW2284298.1 glycosyltransferase involved in cell wall biosynthesis [Rhodoblastus acidophilus]MCW2333224.1 glycosyltransferase involved in cell wall biosynthesis [Rhodoblastus acidophilus]